MATPAQIAVSTIDDQIQRRRQLEDQGRQQTLAFNQGILNNPDAPDDQKLQARQNIQGLYPTPAHAPQFLLDLLHIKHKQAQGNQPAVDQATSHGNAVTNTPATGSGGTESAASAGPPTATNPAEILQGAAPQVPTPQPTPQPQATPAPVAQVRKVGQAQTPQDALAMIHSYASPGQQANTLAQQMADKQMEREMEIAKTRGQYGVQEALIRAMGNVSMQKLNGAAQALGAEDFASASPEVKMQAIKSLHQANVTTSWKPFVDDQQNAYAVDAHDPSKRTLLGHKSDLTTSLDYKTMKVTDADGSEHDYLSPVTVWHKKGSTVPAGQTDGPPPAGFASYAPPASANTPSGPTAGTSTPPNGGAVSTTAPPPQEAGPVSSQTPQVPGMSANQSALNGKLNKKKSQSNQLPVSANTPSGPAVPKGAIPFGGKESQTLYKAAAAQYEKQVPILESSETSINNYIGEGNFTGAGDLALQHEFFTATQPSTGFRMTKVQQDILQNSQSWMNSIKAQLHHAMYGTWFSDEQRQQIADAALSAIADKKKAYADALQAGKNPNSVGGPTSSKHEYAIDNNGKRRKVLDPKATLPQGWKWAD